jgi:ankyrin repeat protein
LSLAPRIDLLDLFLAKNAAIVRASYDVGERNTAWHYAAGRGHGKALAALAAAARAQPDAPALLPRLLNAANSRGRTALALACEAGHERCTAELIGAGADVWLADAAGRTPLHLAASRCHRTCVKLLLTRAAQRDALAAADMEAMKRCGRALRAAISPQPPLAHGTAHACIQPRSPPAGPPPPMHAPVARS